MNAVLLRDYASSAAKGDEQPSALSPANRKPGERDPLSWPDTLIAFKIDRRTKTAKSGWRNNSYDLLPKEICARSRPVRLPACPLCASKGELELGMRSRDRTPKRPLKAEPREDLRPAVRPNGAPSRSMTSRRLRNWGIASSLGPRQIPRLSHLADGSRRVFLCVHRIGPTVSRPARRATEVLSGPNSVPSHIAETLSRAA